MKKIFILFSILFFFNNSTNAQVYLASYIYPVGKGTYPTHIDSLSKGGYMSLPTIETRDAISVLRRKQGMLVYVQSNDSIYKLSSADLSNNGWVAMGLYTQEKFNDAWNYYDVNKDGHVDASWVATILRFMCRPDVDLGL